MVILIIESALSRNLYNSTFVVNVFPDKVNVGTPYRRLYEEVGRS